MSTKTVVEPQKMSAQHSVPVRSLMHEARSAFPQRLEAVLTSKSRQLSDVQVEPGLGHDFSRVPVYSKEPVAGQCPLGSASPKFCPFGGACHTCPVQVQPKLRLGHPGDEYEHEADRMAEKVLRMPEPSLQRKPNWTLQESPLCGDEEEILHKKELAGKEIAMGGHLADVPSIVYDVLRSPGQPLDTGTRAFIEPRLGHDFSRVRIHADAKAGESARAVNALAYTVGRDMVFGIGQYAPGTLAGRRLLGHELMHVVQQNSGNIAENLIQRANLKSPRLAGNLLFKKVLDDKAVIEVGVSGSEVARIQQLLIDLGFALSAYGADGKFGTETATAVKAFQKSKGLNDDGRVESATIDALDKAFPAFTLPGNRTNPWSMPCILNILCPWNKYLVENVLPTYNIITFDSRTFPTEKWDGTTWVKGTFSSGGFTSGTNLGFKNTTCERFAFTIYHEGWHAKQPSSLTGVVEVEKDAYIHAEQWSISAGIPGQTFTDRATGIVRGLRTTKAGETVVDIPAAEKLVRQEYGGVSALPGEIILNRVGTTNNVRVRRADTSEYTRPAKIGESVRGPVTMVKQRTIPPTDWKCP